MKTLPTLSSLAAAVLLAGCNGRGTPAAKPDAAARALAVRALAVESRPFERRLAVQGTLEARRFANVSARTAGNLDAVWVEEGDPVTVGETRLFQVDPVSRSNALAIAEEALAVSRAALAVSRAQAEQARVEADKTARDLARYTRLHEQARVSDNEFETQSTLNARARAALTVADAQVELAERQVRQADAARAIAEKNLADALAVAPLSGVVSERRAEPGEQVDVGRVILRIVDPTSLEAAAFLPARYYADITPGQTRFRLAVSGSEPRDCTVRYRSPAIDTSLRTFEIKGDVDGAGSAAAPGAMATLTLVFESREGLGVPSAALLERSGRTVVFVVRDGKAVQTEVRAGLQNDGWTEILSGLQAGDRVIVEGQTQLDDQIPVDVR